MVTPVTPDTHLDEGAVARILAHLQAGRVHGVFVLGTTGEARSVPSAIRDRLVQLAVEESNKRTFVYAGINGSSAAESVATGNKYLRMGVDAVVAHIPARFEQHPQAVLKYFSELCEGLEGDLILYNIPLTTNLSLPIELCKETARRPRVIGLKDSENNAVRMVQLLRELGDQQGFSIFIGTGPLMAKGLLLGAEGIVPSVGNIAPGLCRELYDSAVRGDVSGTEALHRRFMEMSNLYQNGRELGHSIAMLKAAMSWMGLCGGSMLPPLKPVNEAESLELRERMIAAGLAVGESSATVGRLATA